MLILQEESRDVTPHVVYALCYTLYVGRCVYLCMYLPAIVSHPPACASPVSTNIHTFFFQNPMPNGCDNRKQAPVEPSFGIFIPMRAVPSVFKFLRWMGTNRHQKYKYLSGGGEGGNVLSDGTDSGSVWSPPITRNADCSLLATSLGLALLTRNTRRPDPWRQITSQPLSLPAIHRKTPLPAHL